MSDDAVVRLTENAANEVRAKLAAEAEGAAKGLRVYVEKGGCSGLQYGMVWTRNGPMTPRRRFLASRCWWTLSAPITCGDRWWIIPRP